MGWWISHRFGQQILINEQLFLHELTDWNVASILFSLATLGPLLASMIVGIEKKLTIKAKDVALTALVGGIFFAVMFVVGFAASDFSFAENVSFRTAAIICAYFLLTSATEEFGWRGVVQPHIYNHHKSVWSNSVVMGLIWGPWHSVFVLYLFIQQGITGFALLSSYIGFIASIVLMSYLHSWLFVRGVSVIGNYMLHAVHNAVPAIFAMLFAHAPYLSLITILAYLSTIAILEFLSKHLPVITQQ